MGLARRTLPTHSPVVAVELEQVDSERAGFGPTMLSTSSLELQMYLVN